MVVASMEQVEQLIDMTGPEKKHWVLKQMRDILGDETYDRYKDILPSMIDFIIAISKNKYFLGLNNVKDKCTGCFPWC
jgi:hypothetical protein